MKATKVLFGCTLIIIMILCMFSVNAAEVNCWSEWLPDLPEEIDSSNSQIECCTQYRYRDKQYATSQSPTLSGWIFDYKEHTSFGAWSSWSTVPCIENDTIEVEEKTESETKITGYDMLYYCTMSADGVRHYRSFSIEENYSAYGVSEEYGEHHNNRYATIEQLAVAPSVAENGYGACKYNGNNDGYGTAYILPLYDDYPEEDYIFFIGDAVRNTVDVKYYRYRTKIYTYHFYKWGSWSQWGNEIIEGSDSKDVETRTVYRYKKYEYIVQYNANGGTGAPASAVKVHGADVTVSSEIPTKSFTVTFNAVGGAVEMQQVEYSCEFLGWAIQEDKTDADYFPGSTFSLNQNTVLYAVWGLPEAGTLSVPQKSGYTFMGWYDSENYTTKVLPDTQIFQDSELFALWSERTARGIEICTHMDKQNYYVGETLCSDGLSVLVWYDNGETKITSEALSLSCDLSNPGIADVAISYSEGEATFTVHTSVDVKTRTKVSFDECFAAAGDEIVLPVNISDNSGIMGFSITVLFDEDIFALIDVSPAPMLSNGFFTCSDVTNGAVTVIWTSTCDIVGDSELFFITLKINKNAPICQRTISLSYNQADTFNEYWENVGLEIHDANVSIITPISILQKSVKITVGEEITLNAQVYPISSFLSKAVVWNSGNSNVASVDENGNVHAKSRGTVRITAQILGEKYVAICYVQVIPNNAYIYIYSNEGSFSQHIDWWKKYTSATMTLGYQANNCENAARYVWSSSSTKVRIDQNGNITNTGSFSRSATITLTAYDAENNVIAKSTVTVSFYKFSWQYSRLQSQSIVSDNILQQNLSEKELLMREAKQQSSALAFITDFVNYLLDLFKVIMQN